MDNRLKNESVLVSAMMQDLSFRIRIPITVSEKKMSSGEYIEYLQENIPGSTVLAVQYAKHNPITHKIIYETPWFINPKFRKEFLLTLPRDAEPVLLGMFEKESFITKMNEYLRLIDSGLSKTDALCICLQRA